MSNRNIKFIDKTGQPRSDDELKEALRAIENVMVKNMLNIPPELATVLLTIRAALKELLGLRALIARLKKERKNNGK